MEKMTIKLPAYVKQFYADNKFKMPMAQYAAMILIDYAIENGAKEKPKYDKDGFPMIEH